MKPVGLVALAAVVLALTTGCSDAESTFPTAELRVSLGTLRSVSIGADPTTVASTGEQSTARLFPAGAVADYQLGGSYPPAADDTVVARDSTEVPEPGLYSICYVNGFQSQPDQSWPTDLLLHDAAGDPVIDENWPDETLLDIGTVDNRAAVAALIGTSTARCADAGFDAIEFDNLDSWTRSGGALSIDDAFAFATLLVTEAHRLGLAAGHKNAADLLPLTHRIGYDFAVVEECDQFEECAAFTDEFGGMVIDIEYPDSLRRPFAEVCADPATPASTVLRDRDLTPDGNPDHLYDHC